MLAPILFGSGSSGTTTSPSSGTTSGSTSSPPPSETTQPSYQEPEAAAPGDIDDGTYQPAPSEETGEPSPAVDEGSGAPEEVTAETPPAQTEADAEPTPVGEEPASSETEPQAAPEDTSVSNDNVVDEGFAEDAATGPEADTAPEASPTATTPSPVASDRPVTAAPASERVSAEDAIEAAALAEYRGKRVSPEGAASDFAQQVRSRPKGSAASRSSPPQLPSSALALRATLPAPCCASMAGRRNRFERTDDRHQIRIR